MALQLFANNATTTLAVAISAVQTTLEVEAGKGALFPAPTGGDYFLLTLEDVATGEFEIVKATSRAEDVITIERAQESTTGLVLSVGSKCELRVTKETLEELQNLALSGGAQAVSYDFSTPQSTWSIIHNLNRYPGVNTFQADFTDPQNPIVGNQIVGDITYVDENTMQVSFGGSAVAGRAYLN